MFGLFRKKPSEEELYYQELERRKQEQQAPDGPGGFRMEIQDVFTITGRGTVVTGQVASGRVRVGDQAVLYGDYGTQRTRVAGIEFLHRSVPQAEEGDNTDLLLGRLRYQPAPGDQITGTSPAEERG